MIIHSIIFVKEGNTPRCRYCSYEVECSADDETWGFTKDWRGEIDTYFHKECMQEYDDPPEIRREW